MAYNGEELNACGVVNIDLTDTYIVAVSGVSVNKCGHLLFYAGNRGGYYFHVDAFYDYPLYMNEAGYRRYLKDNGKTELKRRRVNLPNPNGALLYIEQLLANKRIHLLFPNNCVDFVEDIIEAGGGTWGSTTNCPVIATSPSLSERIQSFYNRMESDIYNLYGVPR